MPAATSTVAWGIPGGGAKFVTDIRLRRGPLIKKLLPRRRAV
jgi:hypothetical protein